VVDEQHRVKGLASLARKFLDAVRLENATPQEFLGEVNDRVRFSVQTPEQGYGQAVDVVLDQLRSLGYEIDPEHDVKNFWQPGNRHNGVNVTARTPEGFTIEVQFPTPVSRALGKRTHELYQMVRLHEADAVARVEALLEIFRLNREFGMDTHLPGGLDLLPPAIDTSLARWTDREPQAWTAYQEALAQEGRTLADVLVEHGLDAGDFSDAEGMELPNGERAMGLPRGVETGYDDGADEPDSGVGVGGEPVASGDLEPAGEGMGVGTGDRGTEAVRRPVPGHDESGGPADRGTDSQGEPRDGATERGAAPADLRGGREAAPGLGPADAVAEPPTVPPGVAPPADPSIGTPPAPTGSPPGPISPSEGPELQAGVRPAHAVTDSTIPAVITNDDSAYVGQAADAQPPRPAEDGTPHAAGPSRGGSDEVGVLDGPVDVTPSRAQDVLNSLSRTELSAVEPLPTLGTPELPVERGDDGLIDAVAVDGSWVDIRSYVGLLADERVALWQRYVDDPDYMEIRRQRVRPCVSVAVDRLTGRATEGHNQLSVTEAELHPLIGERLDAYRRACEASGATHEWESPYLHFSTPGAHSEIYSVSELLWAREALGLPVTEESLGELRIDNRFPWGQPGNRPAPCCANCAGIIGDVPCNSGKFYGYPPDPADLVEE
jgi:hypothetical protein